MSPDAFAVAHADCQTLPGRPSERVKDEPIGSLVARYQSLVTAFNAGGHSDEETGSFTDEVCEIVDLLSEKPSAGVRDLLAKAEIVRHEVLDACGGLEPNQVDALILSLLDDMRRVVG